MGALGLAFGSYIFFGGLNYFESCFQVRITDGASLYVLCRSWLRNGSPEESQVGIMLIDSYFLYACSILFFAFLPQDSNTQ